jgi:hypothetical protein
MGFYYKHARHRLEFLSAQVFFIGHQVWLPRERAMSSPGVVSSKTDRTTRTARFGGPPGVGNARPRSNARVGRAFEVAVTMCVLILIMFGGFALRAALSLSQGFH